MANDLAAIRRALTCGKPRCVCQRKSGNVHCPAHQDDNPSLSIAMKNERVVWRCFAGCSQDNVMNALKERGLCPPGRIEQGRNHRVSATGRGQAKRETATYRYLDEAGGLLYEVVRLEPKGLRQRRPDGNGGHINGTQGVRRVLYRLPEVLAGIGKGQTIYIVEGEKDADNLWAIGIVATTNAMGANATWLSEYSRALRDAHVVILPDNDEPGRKHAENVAQALADKAASVRILELPGLPEKGDVSDWLKAGGTAEQLLQLAADAPPWTPPSRPPGTETPATEAVFTPIPALDEIHETDLGNAQRLIRRHGDRLRFVPERGKWLVWDGKRWVQDETGGVRRLAHQTIRDIYAEVQQTEDPDRRRSLVKHALASESAHRIDAMVRMAQDLVGITVPLDRWDQDTWQLCVENGVINLKTGELLPGSPERLITKLAPVTYDPSAKCPRWDIFLKQVLPDPEVRSFVQCAVGYALTGDVSEQVLFFLYGSGANGKSTFLRVLQDALGDYALQAASDLLLAKNGTGVPNDVAELKGRRFVSTTEVEDGRHLAESLVKQLTGGDRIKARFMRRDFFEFEPTHKLFLAANHRPVVRGNDHAMWRRIKVIPFTVTIPTTERDPHLLEKLREELPGILRWAMEGCLVWQREGLRPPKAVEAAGDDYRGEMDVVGQFIADMCTANTVLEETAKNLYDSFENWCSHNGEQPMKSQAFGHRLAERGFTPKKGTGGVRKWAGIALRDDEQSGASGG